MTKDEGKRNEVQLLNLQVTIEIEDELQQVHHLKAIDIGKYIHITI